VSSSALEGHYRQVSAAGLERALDIQLGAGSTTGQAPRFGAGRNDGVGTPSRQSLQFCFCIMPPPFFAIIQLCASEGTVRRHISDGTRHTLMSTPIALVSSSRASVARPPADGNLLQMTATFAPNTFRIACNVTVGSDSRGAQRSGKNDLETPRVATPLSLRRHYEWMLLSVSKTRCDGGDWTARMRNE